jgi:hypothetical protein
MGNFKIVIDFRAEIAQVIVYGRLLSSLEIERCVVIDVCSRSIPCYPLDFKAGNLGQRVAKTTKDA